MNDYFGVQRMTEGSGVPAEAVTLTGPKDREGAAASDESRERSPASSMSGAAPFLWMGIAGALMAACAPSPIRVGEPNTSAETGSWAVHTGPLATVDTGATTGPVAHTGCPASMLGVYVVCSSAETRGSGTADDPWRGWEAGVNRLPPAAGCDIGGGGTEVFFPPGHYYQRTTISTKAGWNVHGAGERSSAIYSGAVYPPCNRAGRGQCADGGTRAEDFVPTPFLGDAILSESAVNRSTAVHLTLSDLEICNGDSGNGGAAVDIVGGTYVYLKRLFINGFKYGTIFDQAEIADIDECDFEGQSRAGLWLVNDGDHIRAAHSGYTNSITVSNSQFNPGSSGPYGIVDDGGYAHTFRGNCFNGGENAIRMAGTYGASITGCYFESQSSDIIESTYTPAENPKEAVAGNYGISISGNTFSAGAHHVMTMVDGTNFVITGNLISSSVAAFYGVGNTYAFYAMGNVQAGSGPLFDSDAAGISLLTDAGGMYLKGVLAFRAAALSSVRSGANHDVNAGTTAMLRITGPKAPFSISGFSGGTDGRVLQIYNASGQQMTLVHAAGSSAGNQINTLSGQNLVLRAGSSFATLIYDATAAEWVVASVN